MQNYLFFFIAKIVINSILVAMADIRQHCWNEALHSFGTGYIFELRAKKYRFFSLLLKFFGLLIPASVGYTFIAFKTQMSWEWILTTAFILGLIQFILSLWSIIAKWDDELAYSRESCSDNYLLSNEFKKLGERNPKDIIIQCSVLDAHIDRRSSEDLKHAVSEKEKRKGMRSALRNFNRECATCKEVPISLKPTDCDTCGNF